jgi:hypothetical protein
MSAKRVTIGARPAAVPSADAWVQERSEVRSSSPAIKSVLYTARLTIDVTPQMRARIKVAAFQGGVTVAELIRGLLEREFPNDAPPETP